MNEVKLTKKQRIIQLIVFIILSSINILLAVMICRYFGISNHIIKIGISSYSLTYEICIWFSLIFLDISIVYLLFGKKWID